MRRALVFARVVTLACFLFSSTGVRAGLEVDSHEKELLEIPKSPSQPPALNWKAPKYVPHCERYFLYAGKKMECDSNLGWDGEVIRPLIREVPQALAELDLYQKNLKSIRVTGYVITAAAAVFLLGLAISHPPVDERGNLNFGGYVSAFGGLIGLNSIIYGFSVLRTNEEHLNNAVNAYNALHPEKSIELQFSTAVDF